jgi:transcriptional regulator with XRE-family HTH domain
MKDRELPKTPSRTPTIREVAARAGVSPATVSNTLSGLRGVTRDRRRVVLEAVAALGYTSNHAASSLRRGQTRTVGIVVPNLGNEFYAGLVREWEKIASLSSLEMLVVASGEDPLTEAHASNRSSPDKSTDFWWSPLRTNSVRRQDSRRVCPRPFSSIGLATMQISIRSVRTISTRFIAAPGIFWNSATGT